MSMSVAGKSNKVDLLKNLNRVDWIIKHDNPIALQCIACLAHKDIANLEFSQSRMFCNIHAGEWTDYILALDETEEGQKHIDAMFQQIEAVSEKALRP